MNAGTSPRLEAAWWHALAAQNLFGQLGLPQWQHRAGEVLHAIATQRLPVTPRSRAGPKTGMDRAAARRPAIVAVSAPMREVLELAQAFALGADPILITGETGTGKELLARFIHACSVQARGPFVAVNCAALPAHLFERELFGHARGAYTGAERDGPGLAAAAADGTLFLDEIGELPLELQPKLLRFLEDGSYRRLGDPHELRARARILAATNANLDRLADSGRFRRDLLYRLRILEVAIPPLRERPLDVLPLLEHFLGEVLGSPARAAEHFSPAELRALTAKPWRGNARELQLLARRRALAGTGATSPAGREASTAARQCDVEAAPRVGRRSVTREQLQAALAACGGNRRQAARQLGVSRQTLYRWLRLSGLA